MGMYTELILGCKLKPETPQEVIDIIKWMCEPDDKRGEPPEAYPFSSKGRMKWLFRMSSYYFSVSSTPAPHFVFDENGDNWILSTRSNLKNYEDEIETFLEWLKPHIESGSGEREFYAIVTYEEQEEPTIYYLHEKE